MWYAAGMASVVAALMLAALASRWLSRQHPTHRAGIGEDEDDPEPDLRDLLQPPGETKTFVVPANLWPRGVQSTGTESLGPPPTYPETPEEHTR
jgi:hypothetical protein